MKDLADLLFLEGWGTRRECHQLVSRKRAEALGYPLQREGTLYRVEGKEWVSQSRLLVALNKPRGYECSTQPRHHPSVLALLPPHWVRRGLQPVGRLDVDTTGLLLLTDDGPLNHYLCRPGRFLKTYRATVDRPLGPADARTLEEGVMLRDGERARALAVRGEGSTMVELDLDRGVYHQVKRMLAAVGYRCLALERRRFGPWGLDTLGLGSGQWVMLPLTDQEDGSRIGGRPKNSIGGIP